MKKLEMFQSQQKMHIKIELIFLKKICNKREKKDTLHSWNKEKSSQEFRESSKKKKKDKLVN